MKILSILVLGVLGVQPLLAQNKVDFAKEVLPILEKNCFKCHGPEKQKGKMRLDSREAALKGGKDGPAFVVGNADKSVMVRRISLPKSDDDFMPNEGEPLTKQQIDLIRDWINQGAVWAEGASAKAGAKEEKKGPVLPADFKPGSNEAKAIAKIAESGVDVRPIAVNVPWREANFRLQSTNINDQTIAPLKDVLSLTELNLATTKVTDAGLQNIKNLSNLMRLHLELTGITDAGLANIKSLKNLVYLNLYGTKVTDAGLENLKGLSYLRNLYVWQTKVTDSGVANLKKALPDLQVSTGWDLKELAKIEEAQKAAAAKKKQEEEAKKKEEEEKKKEADAKKDTEKKDEKKDADKKDEKKDVKPEEKKEAKADDKKADAPKKDAAADKKDEKKDEKKEEKKQN